MSDRNRKDKLQSYKVENPTDNPCLVTGHKMYLIGCQDGNFAQRGAHIPYEMWGLWAPPFKVLDGFWLLVNQKQLGKADQFEISPCACSFFWKLPGSLSLKRLEWIPQDKAGMILEVSLGNESGQAQQICLELVLRSHLMPTWLSERLDIRDGKDTCIFCEEEELLYFSDEENPWALCVGASEPMALCPAEKEGKNGQEHVSERTCTAKLRLQIQIPAQGGKNITFYFAASAKGKRSARSGLISLREHCHVFWQEKNKVFQMLGKQAALTFPAEPELEEMYQWAGYVNEWIVRSIGGGQKGAAAGYPEFPWWFGNDTNYLVPALLMQGKVDVCRDTLRLIKNKSEEVNGNGRVVHEISNNGVVYYEGMSTETPQFADTVWMLYCFDGDKDFLEEMYGFCQQGIAYMESICKKGLPRGYGISEIAGLDCWCCDTALMLVRDYEVMADMAEALGRREAAEYRRKQKETWTLFQEQFYMPQYGTYGDMVAEKKEIIERVQSWKVSLKSFPITDEDQILSESSCRQDKSPEGEEEKARLREQLDAIIQEAEMLPDGTVKPYELFGLEHSRIVLDLGYLSQKEGQELWDAMKKRREQAPLHIEKVMPIRLGREMVSLGGLNDAEGILEKLKEVAKGFGTVMPGATSEIYPDSGCFVQAWNSYAIMWPYFNSIFGVKPDAAAHTLTLSPCICDSMEGLTLTNVWIGGQTFSFSYGRGQILVTVPDKTWKVKLCEDRKQYRLCVRAALDIV